MKKLIALILILVGLTFAQTNKVTYLNNSVIQTTTHAFTPATGNNTFYSGVLDVDGYDLIDTLKSWKVSWTSNDSVQVTIVVQGRKAAGGQTSAWKDIGTVVTSYYGDGVDSLNSKFLFKYGTYSAQTVSGKAVSLTGFDVDQVRLRFTYANKATIGDSGTLKLWLTLPKNK